MKDTKQFKMNMPADVKMWIAHEAVQNMRSQTAQIIFTLKEKMSQQSAEHSYRLSSEQ